jgi:predicted ester cyclase
VTVDSARMEMLAGGRVAADAVLHLPCPIDDLAGAAAVANGFWAPLLAAFPDVERRTDILMEGAFKDASWRASSGWFAGTFAADWLGIPATGRPAWLRYGWFDRMAGDVAVESYVILDIIGLMRQAGACPLPPALGQEIIAPGPATRDGVRPAGEGTAALKLVEAMIAGLMRYDRKSLASMGMRDFWTPDFHWYGPAGIGFARGHADYERAHQGPFLAAFPDRVGGDHKCRIGQGDYVASTGWPSIRATHSGGDWLGLAPTDKRVTMRVMDFWRAEGGLLKENWVFIDIPDLLRQLGIDLFARMRALKGG